MSGKIGANLNSQPLNMPKSKDMKIVQIGGLKFPLMERTRGFELDLVRSFAILEVCLFMVAATIFWESISKVQCLNTDYSHEIFSVYTMRKKIQPIRIQES